MKGLPRFAGLMILKLLTPTLIFSSLTSTRDGTSPNQTTHWALTFVAQTHTWTSAYKEQWWKAAECSVQVLFPSALGLGLLRWQDSLAGKLLLQHLYFHLSSIRRSHGEVKLSQSPGTPPSPQVQGTAIRYKNNGQGLIHQAFLSPTYHMLWERKSERQC